jgi:hypothetical protein
MSCQFKMYAEISLFTGHHVGGKSWCVLNSWFLVGYYRVLLVKKLVILHAIFVRQVGY